MYNYILLKIIKYKYIKYKIIKKYNVSRYITQDNYIISKRLHYLKVNCITIILCRPIDVRCAKAMQ